MTSSVITRSQKTPPIAKVEPHRLWWRYVGQGLGFILLALILLEGYFKLAGVGGGEFMQPDLRLGSCHIPGKQVIWRLEGFSDNRMNSAGLRDSEHAINKEPGVYRIALLGDSFVEALQVDLNQTFGKILEAKLNQSHRNKHYEVINFGCGAYSTGQECLQYQSQVAQYKPDAIVLFYNRGDSMESIVKQKERKRALPRPYFYIDQDGRLKEDDSILSANIDKLKPQPLRDWLRNNSTVYGVLNQTDFTLNLNEPLYRKLKGWWGSILSWSTNTGGASPAPTDPSYSSVSKPAQQQISYPDQDEMVVTKALIGKLASQAASQKQTFILCIYPNINHYAELTEQAKQLKAFATENHFVCRDLSPAFLADTDPHSNFFLYHLNQKGHTTVANQLFQTFCATN